MKRIVPALSIGVLAALALPLRSQEAPPDLAAEMADILNTDQIGAASKHAQDVASAPADVVVLRASDLKALGYRTLGDALGGVLGFRSNQDHAYQGLAAAGLYILGDQNTRILVLLDGHALNSPAEVGSSKVGEEFGLPLELVDHVEIVRGPASTLYGNNAYQALVNVVSCAAAGERQAPLQAAVTAGSGGLTEIWAQETVRREHVTTSLLVSGFQRTGSAQQYPQLQPAPLPAGADREERQNAYLYLKGGDWSLAGAVLSRTQRLASAPYGSIPGDPANWYRNRRAYGEFKWEPKTDSSAWMVRAFGDRNEFDDQFDYANAPGPNYLATDSDPDRSLGLELQGRFDLDQRFSLTVGSEQQFHRFNGVSVPGPGQSINTDVAYRVGNSYLEGNWRPSAVWNLVAGVQWAEWRPTQVQSSGAGGGLEAEAVTRLTPRLSLICKPDAADVVKLIYGQGFRFPTLFEAFYTDGQTQAANPGLQAEVLTTYQVDWTRKWSSRFSSHAAAILFDGEHTIQEATDASGLEQYQNASGALKGRAGELELTWQDGGTQLSAGAGCYDWTFQGAPMPDASKWLAVFKAVRRMGQASAALEARFVGARQNPDGNDGTEPTQVPANWTLRTSLRWDGSRAWAQLSLEDLTNSRRQDLVAPEYAQGGHDITWMEADGRTLVGTLGVRF
jgi:iron complex outermembrane receptor protein